MIEFGILVITFGVVILWVFGLMAWAQVSYSKHDSNVEIAKAKAREAEMSMKEQELIVKELELRGKE